ncbi:UDP-glucuronate 4-epimerase 6-like [Miscanthus floridulus]|uniref:UDP-glucuronate 4-epimerase 6-like n=1 Tax=Miscanthus floridulus TaxID=154761 RepID=UPI00345AC5F6
MEQAAEGRAAHHFTSRQQGRIQVEAARRAGRVGGAPGGRARSGGAAREVLPSTASKSGKKHGPTLLHVYNLSNTTPVAVTRMVAILEKFLGKKAHKHVITMPTNGDVSFMHANVSHAARDFGYRPTTSLEVGLRHFVDWFVQYYKVDVRGGGNVLAGKTAKRKSMPMSAAS